MPADLGVWSRQCAASRAVLGSLSSNDMSDFDSLPPFPVLLDDPLDIWKWPQPPFDWRHLPVPAHDVTQPCRLETPTGALVEGVMVGIDIRAKTIQFRSGQEGPALSLPFSRFRSLTLTTPLECLVPSHGHALERVPKAAHERDYQLLSDNGQAVMSGRTTGFVEEEDGLFLFVAEGGGDTRLLRVFVPHWVYSRSEFGLSAQDVAAERWISTPAELLAAIAYQKRMIVKPIGQSLIDLGLVTQEQLDRALAQHDGATPLGERLVENGVISKADLHTAIAHKMGYPIVDLTRFPIDPVAARKLPLRMAVRHRSVPLMIDGNRFIVAMDRPSRAVDLEHLYAVAPMLVVAVLASKGQIRLALSSLSQQNIWNEAVPIHAEFFSTTT